MRTESHRNSLERVTSSRCNIAFTSVCACARLCVRVCILVLRLRGERVHSFGSGAPLFTSTFFSPAAIACHGNELFVVDTTHSRVQVLSFRPLRLPATPPTGT